MYNVHIYMYSQNNLKYAYDTKAFIGNNIIYPDI